MVVRHDEARPSAHPRVTCSRPKGLSRVPASLNCFHRTRFIQRTRDIVSNIISVHLLRLIRVKVVRHDPARPPAHLREHANGRGVR